MLLKKVRGRQALSPGCLEPGDAEPAVCSALRFRNSEVKAGTAMKNYSEERIQRQEEEGDGLPDVSHGWVCP